MQKYKWYYFIFPAIFVFLSTIILVFGATPGNKSSAQSKILASLFDVGPETPTIIHANGLTIEGDSTLYIDNTNTYQAIFTPSDTTDQRVRIEVLDNDEEVKLSDHSLTGLKPGEVTLIFTSLADESLTSQMTIHVLREPITSLKTTLTTENTLINGVTSKLEVTSNTKDFTLDDISFLSSDSSILTIDEEGYIYTHNVGKASVFVKAKYYDVSSSPIEINVTDGTFVPVSSLTYQEDNIDIYIGEKHVIKPIFNQDASDKAFRIKCEDADVDNKQVSFDKIGKYDLTITSVSNSTFSKTISFNVKEVMATSITVSYASIQYGKTTKLSYSLVSEVEGLDVTNKDVTFESDDESIATIDASGYVLGLKKGTINISVTWKKDPTVKGSSTIAITSMDAEKYDSLNGIIRKLIGHFGAFLVTGVFGILTAYFFFFKGKMKYISLAIFLVYGLLLAILSEVLQIFAGSRTPAWSDVGIDFSGYAIGAIVTFGILLLIYVKTKRKEISTQE